MLVCRSATCNILLSQPDQHLSSTHLNVGESEMNITNSSGPNICVFQNYRYIEIHVHTELLEITLHKNLQLLFWIYLYHLYHDLGGHKMPGTLSHIVLHDPSQNKYSVPTILHSCVPETMNSQKHKNLFMILIFLFCFISQPLDSYFSVDKAFTDICRRFLNRQHIIGV